jgi:hypothetical protein
LKKNLLASENSEKHKTKTFKKFRKFGIIFFDARIIFFDARIIFFFKKQKFPWKFASGRKIEGARL